MRHKRIFMSGVLLGFTIGLVGVLALVWVLAHNMFVMGVSNRALLAGLVLLLAFPLMIVVLLYRSGKKPHP